MPRRWRYVSSGVGITTEEFNEPHGEDEDENHQTTESIDVADSPADQTRSESVCASVSQEDKELLCSICMEVWTNSGEHQISCLPCGHLYGFSCINKWLQHRPPSSGKCPQCKKTCSVNNVNNSNDTVPTQIDVNNSNGVQGLHVCLKRRGDHYQTLSSTQGFVDPICLLRTTFIDFGDERTHLMTSQLTSSSCKNLPFFLSLNGSHCQVMFRFKT